MTFLDDHTDTLTSLSDRAIRGSVAMLEAEDRLTVAMREALKSGISIDDLSAMTGVPPGEIERRTNGNLRVLDDLALLA